MAGEEEENLFKIGIQAFKENRYQDAFDALLKESERDQSNHKVWNALGVTLSKMGDNEQAIICFENALTLDPNNEKYQKNLVKLTGRKISNDSGTELTHPINDTQAKTNPFLSSGYPLKEPNYTNIGLLDPKCPYCGYALDKFPIRKIKCPECKNPIFQKSRPLDRNKVLLTEDEARIVESEWDDHNTYNSINNLVHSLIPGNTDANYRKIEKEIIEKTGTPPLLTDVLWRANVINLETFLKEGNFGHFRNGFFQFAKILELKQDSNLALQQYLTILYLDVNGPNNGAIRENNRWIHPPFDPSSGVMAPGIIHEVCSIIESNELKKDFIMKEFFKVSDEMYANLKGLCPVSPKKAWEKVSLEIERAVRYSNYNE